MQGAFQGAPLLVHVSRRWYAATVPDQRSVAPAPASGDSEPAPRPARPPAQVHRSCARLGPRSPRLSSAPPRPRLGDRVEALPPSPFCRGVFQGEHQFTARGGVVGDIGHREPGGRRAATAGSAAVAEASRNTGDAP
ncbi:hypothetical protein SVIOM342S_05153 [Streptomyces violaceorubidus]